MEAEYRCDYAYHAQIEPLNAIASASPAGDSVEIWAGTQSQTTATEASAKILGIPKDSASGSFAVNRAATIRCQPRVRPKGRRGSPQRDGS